MTKEKIAKIQAAFDDLTDRLKALGVTNFDTQCYKCKHAACVIKKPKKCTTCTGASVTVYTNFEEV